VNGQPPSTERASTSSWVAAAARKIEWIVIRVRSRFATARWRLSLGQLGEESLISTGARITAPGSVRIGKRVFIGADASISAVGGLQIGDEVMVGNGLNVQGGNHALGKARRDVGHDPDQNPPLSIGRGAWIGSCVTILAGSDIGEYAVIAAGAVVTKPVAPWTMVGGVPARFIRDLSVQDNSLS